MVEFTNLLKSSFKTCQKPHPFGPAKVVATNFSIQLFICWEMWMLWAGPFSKAVIWSRFSRPCRNLVFWVLQINSHLKLSLEFAWINSHSKGLWTLCFQVALSHLRKRSTPPIRSNRCWAFLWKTKATGIARTWAFRKGLSLVSVNRICCQLIVTAIIRRIIAMFGSRHWKSRGLSLW